VAKINEILRRFLHDSIAAKNFEVVDGLHQRAQHPRVEFLLVPQQTGLILVSPGSVIAAI
jgi:hypothetical protein